jgi:hypothetical protein
MNLIRNIVVLGLVGVIMLSDGCSEKFSTEPLPNLPPETFLSLLPDGTLRRTTSQQHIHWWGSDKDGLVVGYVISFDSLQWTFTTNTDSTFSLLLTQQDTTYTFYAAAVDNAGNGARDSQTAWGPEPFEDLNNNGQWNPGEPFIDFGAVDPTPASLQYPIRNTPPSVTFVINSDVPETTYTVATFQWDGADLDGDKTIQSYFYALDDTSTPASWTQISGALSNVTLFKQDGLVEGNHIFYLKCLDIAGAVSPTVRMPDTSKVWHVKEPKGDFLIVDDYAPQDASVAFYQQLFDTLMGGRLKPLDILDIKKGATAIKRGTFVPPLINPTFVETIKLFKYIFWYADNGPSMEIAQTSLPAFKQSGGKVFFASGFPESVSGQGSLVEFAPIVDIEPSYFALRLNTGAVIEPVDTTYPALIRDNAGALYIFPRGVIPKLGARVLYRMAASPSWTGQPIMGVKDADQATFVLVAAQLHRFGSPNTNVAALLRRVFQGEFGVQ